MQKKVMKGLLLGASAVLFLILLIGGNRNRKRIEDRK